MAEGYSDNICKIRVPLKTCKARDEWMTKTGSPRVFNFRNLDVFIEEHHLFMFVDYQLFICQSKHSFVLEKIDEVNIKFHTNEHEYELQLPIVCNSQPEDKNLKENLTEIVMQPNTSIKDRSYMSIDLWKVRRLTPNCRLQIDSSDVKKLLESNFTYGFAGKYCGKIRAGNSELSKICHIQEPHLFSPLRRTIERVIHELKDFSWDQYKLNFIELQVPEGHDDPRMYRFDYNDTKLTKDEECLLHNLTHKKEDLQMETNINQAERDCGLVSILLGICYDVRTTFNEPTCESGWTRSVLSTMFVYFEHFDSLKEVVISFLRRCVIYPLYISYEIGHLCVDDAIKALQKGGAWILKQLLVTHEQFIGTDSSNREIFNHYYIEDYIRFVHATMQESNEYFQIMALNLKNVLFDVYKKNLRLHLADVETEVLKEIITDLKAVPVPPNGKNVATIIEGEHDEDDDGDDDDDDDDNDDDDDDDDEGNDGNDDDDENDDDEDADDDDVDEDEDEHEHELDIAFDYDSDSETEEDSVIEMQLNIMDLNK